VNVPPNATIDEKIAIYKNELTKADAQLERLAIRKKNLMTQVKSLMELKVPEQPTQSLQQFHYREDPRTGFMVDDRELDSKSKRRMDSLQSGTFLNLARHNLGAVDPQSCVMDTNQESTNSVIGDYGTSYQPMLIEERANQRRLEESSGVLSQSHEMNYSQGIGMYEEGGPRVGSQDNQQLHKISLKLTEQTVSIFMKQFYRFVVA
jgi:hypothetical protein